MFTYRYNLRMSGLKVLDTGTEVLILCDKIKF